MGVGVQKRGVKKKIGSKEMRMEGDEWGQERKKRETRKRELCNIESITFIKTKG